MKIKKIFLTLTYIFLIMVFITACNNKDKKENITPKDKGIEEEISTEEKEVPNKPSDYEKSLNTELDMEETTYEIVNNLDGVTMTVKEDSVSSTGLTVVIENKSDIQCIFGEFFVLEKKIADSWYQVPIEIEGNYGFEDIGYELKSGESREWNANWEWLYGSLDDGQYRIVKEISDFRDTGDYDKYYLAAEFIIS